MSRLEVPDQGWAWVIAIAACIINTILSGLSRMIGILYVYVLNVYGVTRQEATLPFAIRNSIRMLSGPLVGIVGQSYGIRTVTFGGGIMAAAGAALCCIAPDITWLAIFWGGLHGMGFAFANTLFQVVVNQYFEKYRATASGIALSGACLGSLGFPFMIESILDTYGLAGGFLILGGVVMNVLPWALILKSPPWVENPEKYAKQYALHQAKKRANSTSKASVDTFDSEAGIILEPPDLCNVHNPVRMARQRSLSNNPVEEIMYSINKHHLDDTEGIFSHLKGNESWESKDDLKVVCTLYKTKPSPKTKCARQIKPIIEEEMNVNNGSISTVSEQVSKEDDNSKPRSDTNNSLVDSFKIMWALCKNPVYVLISICMSTYILTFIPILTVIVDYSNDKGLSDASGKYLINAMAIGDLGGRLCFGWVTDKRIMTIPTFMTTMLVVQGAAISLFPMAMTLYSFMAALIVYGMAAGSILVLFPVLVLKYVDMNSQAVAMACVGFCSGIVSFCIPPLIGHFRDTVGSYDGLFFLTGGISVITGGFWFLEPVIVKFYYGENFEDFSNKNLTKDLKVDHKNGSMPS